MNRFDPSRVAIPALAIFSILLAIAVAYALYERSRTYKIKIAAGNASGESYVLAQSLKTVAERHHPNLKITVVETGGTSASLEMLEKKTVDLVAAQADVSVGPSAQLIAFLFGDSFQLLVPHDSKIQRFADLKGKRIGMPRRGGQYMSFLEVASHFGMKPSDFVFYENEDVFTAFRNREIDAVFRVRALGNPAIAQMVRECNARLIGISHGAAMRIKIPSLEPAVIPEGAYQGEPPIPDRDLPTVAVQRMLLAHKDVPSEPVEWMTSVLMERREEVARAIPDEYSEVRPLLAAIHEPDVQKGLGAGLHAGARQFYDRDKPSFVQRNADFVALLLSLVLLGASWLWELKRWLERKQKNRADQFTNYVLALLDRAQKASTHNDLDDVRRQLLLLLNQAVHALDLDQISEESFQSFRAVLVIALDVVREKRAVVV